MSFKLISQKKACFKTSRDSFTNSLRQHKPSFGSQDLLIDELALNSLGRVIFNLLQEIKDNLEPSIRSHPIPGQSKLLVILHCLAYGSSQLTVAYFFICN